MGPASAAPVQSNSQDKGKFFVSRPTLDNFFATAIPRPSYGAGLRAFGFFSSAFKPID
jgi:hypothetical protein